MDAFHFRVSGDLRESTANGLEKPRVIKGFHEKGKRPGLQHHCAGSRIVLAGDKNISCFGRPGRKVGQQFHARHLIHPDIQDGDRHGIVQGEIEKQLWLAKGKDFEAIGLKESANGPSDGWVIVHQADNLRNSSAVAGFDLWLLS